MGFRDAEQEEYFRTLEPLAESLHPSGGRWAGGSEGGPRNVSRVRAARKRPDRLGKCAAT